MDRKLVAWARAVKARQAGPCRHRLPPLWLFTDRARLPNPTAAIVQLPRGLAGVILRDGGQAAAARARRIARLCRQRRLVLAVAANPRLAAQLGAGLHLRGGRRIAGPRPRFVTSSAHDTVELVRARRAGAAVIFLSPVFPTASHPSQQPLGTIRWAARAAPLRHSMGALGGLDGARIRCLPRWCRYAGAIGALAV
jgi:thiamine-phosphate pyrophosphorylase